MQKKSLFVLIILFCQVFSQNLTFAKTAKVYSPVDQYKYEQKVLRTEEIEKYERSLLPKSGYMTREEYENFSRDIPNSKRSIPPYEDPRDVNLKYTPQPIYKLGRYNDPPGSPDLHLSRKFWFNRQENGAAITSPNKDILVYPVIYYYVTSQCTSAELYVIRLDKSLPDAERVKRANIIKREQNPIMSTEKDVSVKSIYRGLTPIDFSPDGTKLIVKEKIGSQDDGIWKTNLWVYDFTANEARHLPEIREAIKFYWLNATGTVLDDKRWDIVPLGFSVEDPDRIVVSAYGWTGTKPKFLGNWSIGCDADRTELVSLFKPEAKIVISGLKLVRTGFVNPQVVMEKEKAQDKALKKKKKTSKKAKKAEVKKKKQALKQKLKEMKQEEKIYIENYNKQMNKSGVTGID